MAWNGTLVNSGDSVSFTGVANSDTTPTFVLLGGKYALFGYSSGTFSAQLNALSIDGTHFIAAGSAVTTYGTFDLPPGSYQIVFGGSAGTANGSLTRIPYRAA
jgi:hypothetical protein